MNEQQLWDDFQFEEPTNKFLMLKTEIMENICHMLNEKKDLYEACLIHPNWSIAAMKVLWEAPRFQRPEQLRAFMNTICSSKKTALLIRDFYLAFLDTKEDSVFKTIVRSTLDRHSFENSKVLAIPKIITIPLRVCERITKLTCYGWQLGRAEWEQFAIIAKHLVELHIIGGFSNSQLNINSFLSNLTSLKLDGNFNIDETWATNLINRAVNLKTLQLSLEKLQYVTLEIICTPNRLRLESLTLTGASEIRDTHISRVLHAFPDLNTFCLEGCKHITAQIIATSLSNCPYLKHLEIRAHPKTLENTDIFHLETQLPAWTPKLMTLLIENVNITDQNLQAIELSLPQLQVLGLKDCPQLTNKGIELIITNQQIKHISQLHIVNCPKLNFDPFIANGLTMATSIRDIYIESCGPISLVDIHRLCSQTNKLLLQSIKLKNYQHLKNSILHTFDCSSKSTDMLIFNKTSINSIAYSDDIQLCPQPNERMLTGRQIVLLAKELDITTQELVDLLDETERVEQKEKVKTKFKQTQYLKIPAKSHLNRLESLKSPTSRPTTPAIWSKDLVENDNISRLNEGYTSTAKQSPHLNNYQEEKEDDDYEYTYNEEDVEEIEENTKESQEIEEDEAAQDDEIQFNLGGWGDFNSAKTESWLKTENVNTAESWQQQEMEPAKKLFKSPNSNNHFKNGPFIREGEGWGEPEKVIPWSDLSTQGYAHDLLKQQKETTFWRMVDGVWTECQSSEPPNGEISTNSSIQTGNERISQPLLFSALNEEQEKNQSSSISVISSDENTSLNNDEDESILFKVNPKSNSYNIDKKVSNLNVKKTVNEKPTTQVVPQDNAKDQWANIAKSNPVMRNLPKPPRNSRRTANPDKISPESITGRWKQFNEENWESPASVSNNQKSSIQQPLPLINNHQPINTTQQQESVIQQTSSVSDLLVDLDDDFKNNSWQIPSQMPSQMHLNSILVPEQPMNKKKDDILSPEIFFWPENLVGEVKKEKPPHELHFANLVSGTTTAADKYQQNTDTLLRFEDISVSSTIQDKTINEKAAPIPDFTIASSAPIFFSDLASIQASSVALTLTSIPAPASSPALSLAPAPAPTSATTPTTASAPVLTPTPAPAPALAPTPAPAPASTAVPVSTQVQGLTPTLYSTSLEKTVFADKYFEDPDEEIAYYKAQPTYVCSLRILVQNKYRFLIMFMDEEVETTVERFCQENNIQKSAPSLLEKVIPFYLRRRTRKILKKKKVT